MSAAAITTTTDTAPLEELASASIGRKAEIIQDFYQDVAFHPSGIMYSMQRMDEHSVRPFTAEDFAGKHATSVEKWRLKPDGLWDLMHNENSITTSGIYLASQAFRYLATKDESALEQAAKAFRSLEIIYEMGVKDGRPGWMGKPYSWRLSDQTSPDQYIDASWGMWAYYPIAPAQTRKRMEEMFVAFADYWRSIDYTLSYFDSHWEVKNSVDAYNLILIAINALAYHFTKNELYLQEARRFRAQGTWDHETNMDIHKRSALGDAPWGFNATFKDVLRKHETICWEANIHAKFAAIAIEIILATAPELVAGQVEGTLARFWATWKYGFGEDFLPYYWYAVDAKNDTWRPLPKTIPIKEGVLFGDPFMSYLSQIRWTSPLTRFMYTSVVAAKRSPAVAADAKALAVRIMEKIDQRRLRWMVDPDAQQLIPEISYMGEVLDSELSPTYIATYWRGKMEGIL
ncbi:MAG TPA: hypothetical protein VIL86_12975 [Tepidisphaeraceae bacterium]